MSASRTSKAVAKTRAGTPTASKKGSQRNRFASLRARIQIASGNAALAQTEVDVDWKSVSIRWDRRA